MKLNGRWVSLPGLQTGSLLQGDLRGHPARQEGSAWHPLCGCRCRSPSQSAALDFLLFSMKKKYSFGFPLCCPAACVLSSLLCCSCRSWGSVPVLLGTAVMLHWCLPHPLQSPPHAFICCFSGNKVEKWKEESFWASTKKGKISLNFDLKRFAGDTVLHSVLGGCVIRPPAQDRMEIPACCHVPSCAGACGCSLTQGNERTRNLLAFLSPSCLPQQPLDVERTAERLRPRDSLYTHLYQNELTEHDSVVQQHFC